jgi:hypothetical protein
VTFIQRFDSALRLDVITDEELLLAVIRPD